MSPVLPEPGTRNPSGTKWPEETVSAVRSAWDVSPPLPVLSGEKLVRALVELGWIPTEPSETAWGLERGSETILVLRSEVLDDSYVAAVCVRANVGPLALIAAHERTVLRALRALSDRPPPSPSTAPGVNAAR